MVQFAPNLLLLKSIYTLQPDLFIQVKCLLPALMNKQSKTTAVLSFLHFIRVQLVSLPHIKMSNCPDKYKKFTNLNEIMTWQQHSSQKQLYSCGRNVQRFVVLLLPTSPHLKVLITLFFNYYFFLFHILSVQELRSSILSPISGDYTCMDNEGSLILEPLIGGSWELAVGGNI